MHPIVSLIFSYSQKLPVLWVPQGGGPVSFIYSIVPQEQVDGVLQGNGPTSELLLCCINSFSNQARAQKN